MHFAFDSLLRGLTSWTHAPSNIAAYQALIQGHLSAVTADKSTARTLDWVDRTPGSIFAQTATAIGIGEPLPVEVCEKISKAPQTVVAAAAGLTAHPNRHPKPLIAKWLAGTDAVPHAIALIVSAHLEKDISERLAPALRSEDPLVRIAAIIAGARQFDVKQQDILLVMSQSEVAAERFAAASALVSLGADQGLAVFEGLLHDRSYRWPALRVLGAKLPEERLRELARKLATAGNQTALAARLAGYAGRTNAIPRLLEFMQEPGIAPYAAEAFGFISGYDYAIEGASVEAPENAPLVSGDDEGVTLPYPDADALGEWWQDNQAGLNANVPLLLGRPREPKWCRQVLADVNMHVTSFTSLLLNQPEPTCLFG